MRNIYFFDIDNTLLDHRTFEIPASALAAIADLKAAGHAVVLATGRSYGHARPYVDLIEPDYVITQNGARIVKDNAELAATPLAREPLLALFDWIEGLGFAFGVNDGDSGYVSHALPHIVEPLNFVRMPFQTHDRFYLHQDAYQAWLFFEEARDAELVPQIRQRFPQFDLIRWHPMGLDLMPAEISKWTGCLWVLNHAGIPAERAVAFGDGLNDIPMILGAGLGIAMDNGHPELKAVADRIAPALQLDGIARMLEEIAVPAR